MPMFISLLVACVILLGGIVLWLTTKVRQQQCVYEELDEALRRSQQHAEEQRLRLVEQADLDQKKNEFISTVSHELRTPLTSIRGALGLLSSGLMGNVDGKSQNLLRIASSNAERLIRLINDILDLERMESGRVPAVLRRCSLYDLTREAVDTMTAMADEALIQLVIDCRAAPDAIYFDADPDRILQVLTNLLANAIKFSPNFSVVSVQIDADPESLLLKVIDHGRGIPADNLESIFNRFQQVESSDSSKKGGTGLGLAICRSIILQHGGVIWAESNQSALEALGDDAQATLDKTKIGATFCVRFARMARAGDIVSPTTSALQARRREGLVLICDDDPGVRVVVSEQLRQKGYDVLEAESGEEVIALVDERTQQDESIVKISAILLDLYLPGISGWETLRQLKKTLANAAIPVIILSVVPPSERLMHSGDVQGWVQKPFDEKLLLVEMDRVLLNAEGVCGEPLRCELVASRLAV
ncbi:MAG: ATP-binding protein [Acidobacteriaceae bacterium]|nr:ATP-binding protein [Acidobacteriaceae bacterium]